MKPIELHLYSGKTADGLDYQHLQIQLTRGDGIAAPEDLKNLKLPDDLSHSIGVVLEGRAPIWLYGYLVHQCHATPWVACYDPRFGGAVVVESHSEVVRVGTVLALQPPRGNNQ